MKITFLTGTNNQIQHIHEYDNHKAGVKPIVVYTDICPLCGSIGEYIVADCKEEPTIKSIKIKEDNSNVDKNSATWDFIKAHIIQLNKNRISKNS